jgi:hypothetical protein
MLWSVAILAHQITAQRFTPIAAMPFPFNRWQDLVDTMLYRVYVVAWEWLEEEAYYKGLSHRASLVASSSRNPDYGAGDGTGTSR